MLTLVVLATLVGSGEVMLATELLFAMVTFERQEIDEVAVLGGALVSNGEEFSRHGCGIGARVSRVLIYALAGVDAQASAALAKSVPTVQQKRPAITSASQNLPPSSRMSQSVSDILGKRAHDGSPQKPEDDVTPGPAEEDDDEDDIGPMPMPADASSNGGARKKRKG